MKLEYRPDIDGLRAIAVIAVIIYHLNNHWLQGGFVGVDVFFVISGYLITKIIYIDILQDKFTFQDFYQRRIKRILPVFFVVMCCTTVMSWYILLPDEFILFLKSLKTTTYFWENMFFAQHTGGYWDAAAISMPILHTWSLAVEEQFYIILPFLLLWLVKINPIKLTDYPVSIICVFSFIAFVSFLLAQFSPYFSFLTKYNYYSLLTGRAGELLLGSVTGILSVYYQQREIKKVSLFKANIFTLIGFCGVILSFLWISDRVLFPSFLALIPTVGTAFILFFYHPRTCVSRILSLSFMVFVGRISYSLYLWHWPVFVLARKYLFIENFVNIQQYTVAVLVVIFLSIVTYYCVERPCRQYKSNFMVSFSIYYLLPSFIILTFFIFNRQIISRIFKMKREW